MRRTLDYAEELTAVGGALQGLIDMDRVATAGYSFGGEEAMILGGARFNLDEFFAGCTADNNLSADCVYREVVDEMARLAGLDAPPEGLWPDWSDPRVDAVVALAPGSHLFGETGTQAMRAPTLLIAGTLDDAVGQGLAYFDTYQRLPPAHKSLVTVESADHFIFLNACDVNPGFVDQDFFWVCSNPVWDMDRVHDLINHFVTAFLLSELKGDAEAAAALAPENISFPGIQYETTAYGAETAKPATTLDEATVAKIESIANVAMAKSEVPGMAVCVVKDGQMVYAKGFGVAELGTDRPITPQTAFKAASVTKTLTAVAIMQLVEQGKVDLDAAVTTYLPWFTMADDRYKDITVRQVMAHRVWYPTAGGPDRAFLHELRV